MANTSHITAAFSAPEGRAPELLVENGDAIQMYVFRNVNDRTWAAAFKPDRSGVYTLRVHHPSVDPFDETVHAVLRGGREQMLTVEDMQLKVMPDSPYGVMFVQISPASVSSNSSMPQQGKRLAPMAGSKLPWTHRWN
jgi:hypothetical protein